MVSTRFHHNGKLAFCLLSLSLLQACAFKTSKESAVACGLAGMVIGGAIAVAADDGGDNNTEGAAAVGAATGGIVGALLCGDPGDSGEGRPRRPAGKKEMIRAGDDDGDGVSNETDICPDTDKKYEVDTLGCPILLDVDHDGVPDEEDGCPGTPSDSGVNAEGCPLVGEKVLMLENIHFAFDKSTLTVEARRILEGLVNTLRERSTMRISIEGHTDHVGSDDYNEHLSRLRALSAFSYLRKMGVAADRMRVVNHGEARPIASNDTEQGRSRNRRVEFIVLEE